MTSQKDELFETPRKASLFEEKLKDANEILDELGYPQHGYGIPNTIEEIEEFRLKVVQDVRSWVIQQIKEEIRLIDKRATAQCASVTHNSAHKMAKERYRRFLEKLLERLEK